MEAEMSARELTFGEKAVGLSFNPSGDDTVNRIKRHCADFIDFLQGMRQPTPDETSKASPEVQRMISIAITEAQTAQMWAVKAATWKE